MTISRIASAVDVSTTTAVTFTVTVQAGDLLLVGIAGSDNATIGAPSGWTALTPQTSGGICFYSHTVVSGESGSYSFTVATSYPNTVGILGQYRSSLAGPMRVETTGTIAGTTSPLSLPVLQAADATEWYVVLGGLYNFSTGVDWGSTPALTLFSHAGDAGGGNPQVAILDTNGAVAATGSQPAYACAPYEYSPTASAEYLAFCGAVISEAQVPLAPTQTTPTNSAYQDLSGTTSFDWLYNNTDGSTEAGYQLRIKISGASSYSYYNASTSALQSSAITNASTTLGVTFPSGVIANGNTYNWSVASYSSYGLLGSFASDFTLVGQAAPTVGMTGPTGTITSATVDVTWAPVFPSGASQTAYQIWVYAQSTTTQSGFTVGQTTGLIWGSGVVNSSATSALTGALPNAQTLVFYLQLTETGGELSDVVSTTATVSYTPPAVPLSTATATILSSGLPVIQIDVTGQDNLLSANDASFEGGIGAWFATNATLAQTTNGVTQGSYALGITVTAAGAATAQSASYPVVPGESYTALGMWTAATTASTITYNLVWLDSTGTVIGQATGATMTPTGGAVQLKTSGMAPSNAATARVQLYINNGAAGEAHNFDAAGIFPWVTDNSWTPGGFVGLQTVSVTRSDGFVLRASPLSLDSLTQAGTFYDSETTPGTTYTYSATTSVNLGNSSLSSLPNVSTSVSTTTAVWWLVNPLDTSLAVSPFVTSFTMTQMEQAAAHTVLGQPYPTIVSSVMGGKDGQLTVQTTSAAEWSDVESVINSRAILWMTNSLGDGLYVRIGPAPGGMSSGYGLQSKQSQMVPSNFQNPVRTITLQYQEVPAP